MATHATPHVLSASTISSDSVTNSDNENLGSIKDLMIDIESGQVAYAVLDFGSFLDMGGKLFAVPWHALKLLPEEHAFLLDVRKEDLKNAHGFDPDHWPDLADRSWQTEVHDIYGLQPYWERAAHYTG